MAATSSESKTCFVISPIGELGSAARERADLVYDFVISAVLEADPFNFLVERADKLGEPGIITNQIIERVIDADLVVADLSDRNPNVFYELAVRHVAQKPFVHLISQVDDIPFDNAAARAIIVDVSDLRSVDRAKKELAAHVQVGMHENAKNESPVSIAVTLKSLRGSGDGEAAVLGEIISQLSSLQSSVAGLARQVDRISAPNMQSHPSAMTAAAAKSVISSPDIKAISDALGSFSKNFSQVYLTELQKAGSAAGIASKVAAKARSHDRS